MNRNNKLSLLENLTIPETTKKKKDSKSQRSFLLLKKRMHQIGFGAKMLRQSWQMPTLQSNCPSARLQLIWTVT